MNDDVIGFTAARRASSFCKYPKTGLAYHLFTDERCARVDAISESTPPKVTLMTVGCSFSWGVGIENDQTFTEILGHGLGIPVANFAMGAYGTVQSIQMLERNIDLKPDIIIYGFQEDHIRRNLSPYAPVYSPFGLSVSYVDFDLNMQPYIHPPNMEYPLQMQLQFWEEAVFDEFGFNDIVWGAKIAYHRLTSKCNKICVVDNGQSRRKSLNFLVTKMGTIAKSINAVLIIVHIPYLERGHPLKVPCQEKTVLP